MGTKTRLGRVTPSAARPSILMPLSETRVVYRDSGASLKRGANLRAGSGCLNSFALEIGGFLPGFVGWRFWGATQGGRGPSGVAHQKRITPTKEARQNCRFCPKPHAILPNQGSSDDRAGISYCCYRLGWSNAYATGDINAIRPSRSH